MSLIQKCGDSTSVASYKYYISLIYECIVCESNNSQITISIHTYNRSKKLLESNTEVCERNNINYLYDLYWFMFVSTI